MKIIEKNEGKRINYNLTGTKLDFADGALTLDLARYQQDDPVTQAMRGLIDSAASQEHQIALLWQAIEKLSQSTPQSAGCVPLEAVRREQFQAAKLNDIIGK